MSYKIILAGLSFCLILAFSGTVKVQASNPVCPIGYGDFAWTGHPVALIAGPCKNLVGQCCRLKSGPPRSPDIVDGCWVIRQPTVSTTDWQNYCIELKTLLVDTLPKNVCTGTDKYDPGTLSCITSTPQGTPNTWIGTIGKGSVISTTGGLSFFTDIFVRFVIRILLYGLLVLSLLFTLIGGIMWIVSGGNKEGLAKAKSTVTFALIGLALGLSSFIILNIVGDFFGSNLLGP